MLPDDVRCHSEALLRAFRGLDSVTDEAQRFSPDQPLSEGEEETREVAMSYLNYLNDFFEAATNGILVAELPGWHAHLEALAEPRARLHDAMAFMPLDLDGNEAREVVAEFMGSLHEHLPELRSVCNFYWAEFQIYAHQCNSSLSPQAAPVPPAVTVQELGPVRATTDGNRYWIEVRGRDETWERIDLSAGQAFAVAQLVLAPNGLTAQQLNKKGREAFGKDSVGMDRSLREARKHPALTKVIQAVGKGASGDPFVFHIVS